MANVVRKFYRYLSASANRKLDEKADPRVQIDQAITEAQRQHQALVQQAAAVLGNRRQLEMRMARQIDEVDNLADSARQAIVLADNARTAGDDATAARYEQTAQAFATQLVAGESSLSDLKSLHDEAVRSSDLARQAVADNEAHLRGQLAERARLLTQLEHTAMQEQMSTAMGNLSSLAPPGDTPSLTEVRDKIEKRYAVALGRHELNAQGVEAKMLEVRRATMDAKATNRLDEIRAALAAGRSSAADAASLEAGSQDTPSLEKGVSAPAPPGGSAPPRT